MGGQMAGGDDSRVINQPHLKDSERVSECCVCGSESSRFSDFARPTQNGWQGRYVVCRDCGLVIRSPRPSQETLSKFYAEGYLGMTLPSEEQQRKDRWVQERRAEHHAEFVASHAEAAEQHVDIGASRGSLMNAVQSRFGCATIGVEPGERRREQAGQSGLKMVASIDELPASLQGGVDLITMSHVLEHLPDPVGYLRDLAGKWLQPEGLLMLEVPNLVCHQAFEFAHLYAFTEDSLSRTLVAAGFEVIEIMQHGQPHSRRMPLYLTAAARPVEVGGSRHLRGGVSTARMRWKRWLCSLLNAVRRWIWQIRSILAPDAQSPWGS